MLYQVEVRTLCSSVKFLHRKGSGRPQTLNTKLRAWNWPKYLDMFEHLYFLSLELRGHAQPLKSIRTPWRKCTLGPLQPAKYRSPGNHLSQPRPSHCQTEMKLCHISSPLPLLQSPVVVLFLPHRATSLVLIALGDVRMQLLGHGNLSTFCSWANLKATWSLKVGYVSQQALTSCCDFTLWLSCCCSPSIPFCYNTTNPAMLSSK